MDEAGLAVLAGVGNQLFAFKLVLTAVHCLWIYDYLLTVGDEIKYAWSGRKSWVFALFVANRYSPVPQIIWSSVVMFDYTNSFCQATKWLGVFHSTVSIVLAEMTIALRVYAVTERNKWFGGALSILIVAQLAIGIYMIVSAVVLPAPQLPEIDLDAFKFCASAWSKLEALLFVNVGVAFEVLVFLVLFLAAKKPRHGRHPGIPSLLDAIWRDATKYFILMTLCNITSDLFLIFAPESISGIPGLASTMLIPLMTSRLMLSLKKAAAEPARVFTLSATSNHGLSMMSRTMRFSSRVPGGSPEVPGTPVSAGFLEEGIELGSRTSRKDGHGYHVGVLPASRSYSDDFLAAGALSERPV